MNLHHHGPYRSPDAQRPRRAPAVRRVEWYEVPDLWPTVEPWVRAGVERPGVWLTAADLRLDCVSRQYVLWLATEDGEPVGCCVTNIDRHPRGVICKSLVFGAAEWPLYAPEVERMATAEGCIAVEVALDGRQRRPKIPNYKPAYVIFQQRP